MVAEVRIIAVKISGHFYAWWRGVYGANKKIGYIISEIRSFVSVRPIDLNRAAFI
jgi:hypothetical protein